MQAIRTRPRPRPDRARISDRGDLAIARLSDGRFAVGSGPFERRDSPPAEGLAFYKNDFSLSDPRPWRVPAEAFEIADVREFVALSEHSVPPLAWQEPSRERFERVFGEVKRALVAGRLVKAVPAVSARASVRHVGNLSRALVAAADDPGGSSALYAFEEAGSGFVGLTPERLFQIDAGRLSTMALAGTARPRDGDAFANDAKELEEHRLVVEALRRRLAQFGKLAEGERRILDVGGMIHFLTEFEVALDVPPVLDAVIAALHPTPAVGIVPRSDDSLAMLDRMRAELGVPEAFGAPFGVKRGDQFEAFVAIRGVFWRGEDAFLPAGCGVVGASQLDREWAELALKRDWVRSAFGGI